MAARARSTGPPAATAGPGVRATAEVAPGAVHPVARKEFDAANDSAEARDRQRPVEVLRRYGEREAAQQAARMARIRLTMSSDTEWAAAEVRAADSGYEPPSPDTESSSDSGLPSPDRAGRLSPVPVPLQQFTLLASGTSAPAQQPNATKLPFAGLLQLVHAKKGIENVSREQLEADSLRLQNMALGEHISSLEAKLAASDAHRSSASPQSLASARSGYSTGPSTSSAGSSLAELRARGSAASTSASSSSSGASGALQYSREPAVSLPPTSIDEDASWRAMSEDLNDALDLADANQWAQLAANLIPPAAEEEAKCSTPHIDADVPWRWASDDDADQNLAEAKVADRPATIATLQAIIDKLAGGLQPTVQQPMKCTQADVHPCLVPVLVALGFERQGGELRLSRAANPDASEWIHRWLIRRECEQDVPAEDLVSMIHRLDAKSARTPRDQYELDCLRDRLIDARFEAQIIAFSSQSSSASASQSASSSSSSALGSGASEQFWLVPWSACRINQLELLGRGGQGIVCAGEVELKGLPDSLRIVALHAADSSQRVRVAFKQLQISKDADMREAACLKKRFRREIHSTLSFESDFLVQGFGYTIDPATQDLYLILRLYDRGSLRSPKVALSLKDRLGIAVDAILGVEYLHSNSLVHRDISPANVFLYADPSDGRTRACLGDLGVVRAEGHEGSTRFHTRGYAAPEAARRLYSPQSDVYSLSAVLLELLEPVKSEQCLVAMRRLLKAGKNASPQHRSPLHKLISACTALERVLPQASQRSSQHAGESAQAVIPSVFSIGRSLVRTTAAITLALVVLLVALFLRFDGAQPTVEISSAVAVPSQPQPRIQQQPHLQLPLTSGECVRLNGLKSVSPLRTTDACARLSECILGDMFSLHNVKLDSCLRQVPLGTAISVLDHLAETKMLNTLGLAYNFIGDQSELVEALMRFLTRTGVNILNLHQNELGPHAARLAAALQGARSLRSLRLSENSIDDDGYRALSAAFQRMPKLNRAQVGLEDNLFSPAILLHDQSPKPLAERPVASQPDETFRLEQPGNAEDASPASLSLPMLSPKDQASHDAFQSIAAKLGAPGASSIVWVEDDRPYEAPSFGLIGWLAWLVLALVIGIVAVVVVSFLLDGLRIGAGGFVALHAVQLFACGTFLLYTACYGPHFLLDEASFNRPGRPVLADMLLALFEVACSVAAIQMAILLPRVLTWGGWERTPVTEGTLVFLTGAAFSFLVYLVWVKPWVSLGWPGVLYIDDIPIGELFGDPRLSSAFIRWTIRGAGGTVAFFLTCMLVALGGIIATFRALWDCIAGVERACRRSHG